VQYAACRTTEKYVAWQVAQLGVQKVAANRSNVQIPLVPIRCGYVVQRGVGYNQLYN